MEMFYNEATKTHEVVEECQSPEGLGPTENSYDLTSLIFEEDTFTNDPHQVYAFHDNQNNEPSLVDELNSFSNNVVMTQLYPQTQEMSMTTAPTNNSMNLTQLKLEESINLTSISQTSLIPGGGKLSGLCVKEEPDSAPNPRRRKLADDAVADLPEYRNKRNRNNIAVRKSREKSKEQQKVAKDRVDSLREENKILENKVAQLQAELKLCRSMFISAGAPIPQVLEDALRDK